MGRSASDILSKHGITLIPEDELAHYGVLGMRWGKRKNSDKSSSSSSDKKTESSSKKDEAPKKPDVKKMSDDELRSAINRLKMEREFAQLTAPEVSQGRKIVGEILREVGKQQAKNFINSSIDSLVNPKEDQSTKLLKTALKAAPKVAPGPMKLTLAKRPGFE